MIAPTAPAAAALACFVAKVQPPRRISAIFPVKAPAAKSPGSQPVVLSASTGVTAICAFSPSAGPLAVYVISLIGTSRPSAPPTLRVSAIVSTYTNSNSSRETL